jgi:hypothetical protein
MFDWLMPALILYLYNPQRLSGHVLCLGRTARQQGDKTAVDLRLELRIALGQRLQQVAGAFLRHFRPRPGQALGCRPDSCGGHRHVINHHAHLSRATELYRFQIIVETRDAKLFGAYANYVKRQGGFTL